MTAAPLTKDQMRADIAAMIKLSPGDVRDDDDLRDLGLDSMQTMDLASAWEPQVPALDFVELFDGQTLADWWDVVTRMQTA
ncbi:MAG: phosphopantetheine-binding protein [Pseudomonadota bacterium]|nr:phosphopantetheine-binding protein [Pseudomonadota bacterium]